MKYFLVFYFILINIVGANEVETRTATISKNLRCLVCDGQSVYESNSDFAESMKKYIKGQLENGKTDEEIFSSLVEKYGQWIVYDPGISRNTLLLWALPLLLFLIGGAIIGKRILKKI